MLKVNPSIFRAYDIRGIYPSDLSPQLFQYLGFVLGEKNKSFLVGHDIRKSGKKLALALISGLTTKGAKVYFSGKTSFGLTFFSGWKLKVFKTLFVTASHLPPEWNGLKINFGDGEPISSKEIQEIKNKVMALASKKINFKKPKFVRVNFKKDYFLALKEKFPLLENNNLKVVLDCGNQSMSLVAPQIFEGFGFNVIKLFCEPDPSSPHRPPEPTFEATKKLRETVLKERADFGVAFDGDGDRAAIIDDKGNYLSGNQLGLILGKHLLPLSPNKRVVKTVACTMAIDEEFKKLKAKIFEVPVGHTFVISTCKKKNCVLGIEESSHIVMPQYFLFDDAILIPLKVAEILLERKKKLSQLLKETKLYPFETKVLPFADEEKFEIMENLKNFLKKKYRKVSTLDGIKVYSKEGWVLIRPSNTEPKIRLYFEAKTQKALKKLEKTFLGYLKKFS